MILPSFLLRDLPGAIGRGDIRPATTKKPQIHTYDQVKRLHPVMYAHEMHACEVHAHGVQAYEVHVNEMHAHEGHAHGMHA
jgi:hypothetical protein